NRFIAHVVLGDETVVCHVKNTGRCKELLLPGAGVYLVESDNPLRKTKYDLVAVEKGNRLINMDAQAPNAAFGEWASAGLFRPDLTLLRPETKFGSSRFDFYWEAGRIATPSCGMARNDGARNENAILRGFVEVKGVTLERAGHAFFPDAPTERGVKHLEELISAKAAGYEAAICFVIQMDDICAFSPNDGTHPAFGAALRKANAAGVQILAYTCDIQPDSMKLKDPVPVRL
ncbi:MAG: DNA/RNA nuclease SfsA, partial [Pseudoflavonifractor sp.]